MIAAEDPDSAFWLTHPGIRRFLAVAPHIQAGQRIDDVLPVLESDFRVQVMWSTPATGRRWAGSTSMCMGSAVWLSRGSRR